jgi:hypothetical protein
MRKNFLYAFILSAFILSMTACEQKDEANFELNISGLEDLGDDYLYEGWLIVDGEAITTGTFSVDANGSLSQNDFSVASDDLEMASTFVLTIEPSPDNDPAPSKVHVLAGDFSGNSAMLSIDHGAALNTNFSSGMGTYLLATPTSATDMDEKSGLWFLDPSSGSAMPGLTLPALPEGWIYEGWAVIDGQPVSTGTFSEANMADSDASFSGMEMAPPYPGEDFVGNAPNGLSFPTDLTGGMAVISVEPVPDNSSAPFAIKPLVGVISADAMAHTPYEMGQNLNFPSGTVTR